MPDDWRKTRWVHEQMNRAGAHHMPGNAASATGSVEPRRTSPPDELHQAKCRIESLERALSEQWEVYAVCFGEDVQLPKRREAFHVMTDRLKALGIALPRDVIRE